MASKQGLLLSRASNGSYRLIDRVSGKEVQPPATLEQIDLRLNGITEEVSMIELIPVAKIKVDRELTPPPDSQKLAPLKQDLINRGLQVPLLLTSDLYIIDGQRRLEAIKEAGLADAICQVTSDFDEAMENLGKAQAGKFRIPMTPSRLYYQYRLLTDMGQQRMLRRREVVAVLGSRKTGDRRLAESLGSYREEYLKVVEGAVASLQYIMSTYKHYMELEEGIERQELRQLLLQGEEPGGSIQRAYRYHRSLRQGRLSTTLPDQRRILESTTATMRGMEASLEHIGRVHRQLPPDEAREWIENSRRFVSFMRSFNIELERQLREQGH